jgi:hypothetical protein
VSRVVELAGRLLAYRERRGVRIRERAAIVPDPARTFAIAPIKIVSDDLVQAIAFGSPSATPTVVTRWNPLSRESSELEALAEALDHFLAEALASGTLPRIWLPHESALKLVELLGYRYKTNQSATPELRNMGWQCYAIAKEATFDGQQIVIVASQLLRKHFTTGQAPVKDGHLGALLAWINPIPGVDPAEEAERRALVPASGVLERSADDKVEQLRRIAKKGGAAGIRARAEIEQLLKAGAQREWSVLVAARHAFWNGGFNQSVQMAELARLSRDRFFYSLANPTNPPSRAHSLARDLFEHEYAGEVLEEAEVCGDALVRERARRRGRAVRATVDRIVQPRANRHPCRILLRSDQLVMRVRRGTLLQRIDGSVVGRVVEVGEKGGERTLTMEVVRGVRRSDLPMVGSIGDWVDTVTHDSRFVMGRVLGRMAQEAAPIVYQPLSARMNMRADAGLDLLATARGLRR